VDVHPIRLVVTDDLRRSRLTVFFRLLLAIPPALWLTLWAIAVFVVAILNWFATLFAGRSPQGFHDFVAGYLRYATQVYAYVYLLANPWPGFRGAGGYPIDLEVDPPAKQSRLTVFFRLLLAIPAIIFARVLDYVLQIVAFFAWFVCLVLGRMPEGLRNLGAYCLSFQQQTYGYALLLTGRYPSFAFSIDNATPGGRSVAGTGPPQLPSDQSERSFET
jgi:hypothetical protein